MSLMRISCCKIQNAHFFNSKIIFHCMKTLQWAPMMLFFISIEPYSDWSFDHLPIVGALLLQCITLLQSNPFFIEWFGHFHSYFDINTNSNTRWEIWWTLISLVILYAKRAYKMWEIMTRFDQDDNSARFWQRLELIAQPSVEAVEPRTYLNLL